MMARQRPRGVSCQSPRCCSGLRAGKGETTDAFYARVRSDGWVRDIDRADAWVCARCQIRRPFPSHQRRAAAGEAVWRLRHEPDAGSWWDRDLWVSSDSIGFGETILAAGVLMHSATFYLADIEGAERYRLSGRVRIEDKGNFPACPLIFCKTCGCVIKRSRAYEGDLRLTDERPVFNRGRTPGNEPFESILIREAWDRRIPDERICFSCGNRLRHLAKLYRETLHLTEQVEKEARQWT